MFNRYRQTESNNPDVTGRVTFPSPITERTFCGYGTIFIRNGQVIEFLGTNLECICLRTALTNNNGFESFQHTRSLRKIRMDQLYRCGLACSLGLSLEPFRICLSPRNLGYTGEGHAGPFTILLHLTEPAVPAATFQQTGVIIQSRPPGDGEITTCACEQNTCILLACFFIESANPE
ncbi:hypothetical protein D3C74_345320 [compost metagenome]